MHDVVRTVGRYELLREIGRGGMSIVYEARDPVLDRVVAVKELVGFVNRDAVERFLREARLLGSLNHPNVVTIYEYFEHDGTPFIAMEYLERGTLRSYIGHLTLQQIGGALEGVLAGLAHAAGFMAVHGDLKPENLLLTAGGRVKIADFGVALAIARATGASGENTVVGTPHYMAPEQAMAQALGSWTDLYAVGCVAFELLTRRVPFDDASSPMVVLLRQVNEPIPSVTSVSPDIPLRLSDWVDRLLVKDPAERVRSASQAWEQLEEILIDLWGPLWRRDARPPGTTPDVRPLTPAPFVPPPEGPATSPPAAGHETVEGPAVAFETEYEPAAAPDDGSRFATGAHAPVSPHDADPPPPARAPRSPPPLEPEPFADEAVLPSAADSAPRPAERGPPRSGRRQRGLWRLQLPRWKRTEESVETALVQTAEPVVTRRTPHLDLSPAAPLQPGTVFEVAVYVDQLAARPGENTEDVVLRAPREITSFRLDVWLVATHHFLITDAPIRTITVNQGEARSEAAVFRAAVVTGPGQGEEPLISASFSCNGRPSGRVTRFVPIVTQVLTSNPAARAAGAGPTLEVDLLAHVPDLVIEISAPENDGRRFEVRVDSPHIELERRTESWFLAAEAPSMVAAAMADFFAADAGRAARLRSLEGAGLEFFDSAPTLFKEVYWRLVDSGRRPRSMLVVSDERSIPWELMVPHRRRSDLGREVHRPLGTEMAIGRWHRESGISPRQRMRLRTSYVVAPEYQTSRRLAHAAEEAEFVCSRFSGQRIKPASFDRLDHTLSERSVDLVHFVCHGESDDSGLQALLLDEPDTLTSRQVRAMPGLAKAFEQSKPMVFLNACEIGRLTRGLVGTAGFAKSFIDLDASCVIGALWSVDDAVAHRVAVEFYEHVLTEPSTPFAEILRQIRRRGYEQDGEDSYAAYCFYGDPTATIA